MNTLEALRAGELAGTRRLKLACGLREFPREIFTLAETLEILDLSGNQLTSLPDDLPRLHRLRIIFCSDNAFSEFPEVLGRCDQLSMVGFKANRISQVSARALPPALRWLILTDNQIEALPPELGRCSQLQKLMLAGNHLQALPPELAACSRLELLRVAANRLTAFPDFLLQLPRLAWLAYAGNPFCQEIEVNRLADTPIPEIQRHALQIGEKLGEGASGVIHQASWQVGGRPQAVALKLFKGALTSDGLPHSEMAACIGAGAHPHLIPVIGKLAVDADETGGLLMALIEADFTNLAGPPSLDSCTRDIYAADQRFSLESVLHIAHALASAARHLHAQGILHGDLYAHNILHAGEGRVLLGDFGAASFVDRDNPAQAAALQRIEVRAFACLLEELLERCDSHATLPLLRELQARCSQSEAAQRPLFAELEDTLAALRNRHLAACPA